nr:MAG TPA: hypothetical protein [Caudoviricetes sp.]
MGYSLHPINNTLNARLPTGANSPPNGVKLAGGLSFCIIPLWHDAVGGCGYI